MISIKLLICTPDEFSDTKVRRVGTASNGAALGCEESSRQPSTICTKLGIPSAFPLPHLPSVPYTLREKRYRKNHPRVRSPKASNQREKISSAMAYKLKDRKEKMLYKGSVYELTLQWDRESPQVLLRYASFLCTHPQGRRQLCTNRLLFQWGRFQCGTHAPAF